MSKIKSRILTISNLILLKLFYVFIRKLGCPSVHQLKSSKFTRVHSDSIWIHLFCIQGFVYIPPKNK
uniref:Uncharacterized protein n=1 Tax=Anguilla anguilla TaxID=7936 RepID=A0A0E9VRV7_ANGAN